MWRFKIISTVSPGISPFNLLIINLNLFIHQSTSENDNVIVRTEKRKKENYRIAK
jgi:hypothetical protein